MKKILCSMLLALLVLFGAINCLAAEDDYYIYRNSNFEDHKIGELPVPFTYHHFSSSYYRDRDETYTAEDCVEVIKLEKDGNADNQAVKFGTDKENPDTAGVARVVMNYYPIKERGVISFSFMVENFELDKRISLNGNMATNRDVRYMENKNYFDFLVIKGNDLYYGNKLVVSDIAEKTWHRIDFVFDINTLNATLWFNGKGTNVTLPANTTNISEVQFHLPVTTKDVDSPWYIDDLRIYEAGEIVDDAVIDAQWQKFKDSSFYPGYDFEMSRAFLYNYMAFRKADGKRFFIVNMDQIFDGSHKQKLPVKTYEKDGKIMVPVRAISELYGAEVGWVEEGQKVTVKYGGNILEVSPNANVYYINGTVTELDYPVELTESSACMDIDILFNFLGKEYFSDDRIVWLDKPNEFDWHMPIINGSELTGNYLSPVQESVDDVIFLTFLFERPTAEEVDTAIRTYSPDNMHPRILFTAESVARIKEGMKTDQRLKNTIDALIATADKNIGLELKYNVADGEARQSYIRTVGESCASLAAGYLFTDDPEKKAEYKAAVWRYLCHLDSKEDFYDDWAIHMHSTLGPGEGSYGLAFSFDWIDWTDEERAKLADIYKRNLFDEVVHAYKCPQWYYNHNITQGDGNMALIINGGFSLLATALYDEDPEYFQAVIRGTLHGTEGGFHVYFPNGEYAEGISYWRYSGTRFPDVLKGWQTSMGTDWGRTEIPGVLETATFPFRMRGATSGYAFGDGQAEDAIIPLLMFVADQTNDKTLAQFRKDNMGQAGAISDVANWVFDTEEYKKGLDVYDVDVMNEGNFTLILKTGWSLADTTVAFHGGANNDPHGHMDVGAVQFDMSGVRFGMQLPRENYELRDRGHYDIHRIAEFWPNGRVFSGGHYYRQKGEGHNTVVANRQFTNVQDPKGGKSYDMKTTGASEFIKTELGDVSSFAWLDMTDTNDIYQSALRGVKLDKINNIIEIQDDFIAKTPTDFLWSMHTYAEIQVAEDGKSAILTQNNQKIKATIINDCDFKFEVLPAAFDETYGTSVKPPFESPNVVFGQDHPFYQVHKRPSDVKQDARKLAVRTQKGEDIEHFKLAVTFQPYVEGNTPVPEYVSVELWENKGVKRQNLASVNIDGKPLDVFEPGKYNYPVLVVTEKSDIPEITATAQSSRVQIETIKATTIPGTTTLVLKQNGETVGMYNFLISPINNTEKFHSDKQLPVVAYSVSSEPESQNGVANLFDGDFVTKFATNEQGGNVIMDLGSVIEGNLKLNISCQNGDKRTENFKIEYSLDGVNYTEVFNGHNSGTTTGLEQFDICNKARFVRVSFYGSSEGAYVSVTELFVSNE